jgi:hypothetical protein
MSRTARASVSALLFLLLVGFWLIAFGAWAGMVQMGMPLPGIEEMWPMILIAGGSLFLLGYLVQRKAFGLVLPGSAAVMLGVFFLLVTVGPFSWEAMDVLWPAFPLIGGLAFVAMWLAALGRHWGLLVPAFLGLAAGVVGLTFTATPFGGLIGMVGWPIVFLSVGASLVLLTLAIVIVRGFKLALGPR